jgi:hypothetical protein
MYSFVCNIEIRASALLSTLLASVPTPVSCRIKFLSYAQVYHEVATALPGFPV